MSAARPRILCISFSDIRGDARVLRQLDVLAQWGEVTTLSYGQRPDAASDHIEIDQRLPSLPQTIPGVIKLALRRYRSVLFDGPAIRAARSALAGREFDVVVANEARALPLAFTVAGSPRIWCDLHEWAPAERSHVTSWRLLIAPFMDWICRTYLPRADAATTVNESIAAMYEQAYGVRPAVVRNAIAHHPELSPTTLHSDTVRLVHSGGAVPGRNIEALIDAVDELGSGYTLDLYLVASRQGDSYWDGLQRRIEASPGTTLHEPVAPADLPATLNNYDLGLFALPHHTPNHRYMLPNKFFDFVQARIGLVFSTAVETDRLITEHGIGVIADGFSGHDIAQAIAGIDREHLSAIKNAVDRAASVLSSEKDVAEQHQIMQRLTAQNPRS
ncbi:glycosyltransferase [Microbacterium sp. YY-01]|uniref:glycosyltransferase n=1 Tax=Microbacterium sp. YY-01 TaxID=3421634 RepID=UPI003D167324